ncbi:MAG TPA: TfoX/Sxy family protein [Verrucomicrobiae bacterium]|jgi:DNA transformation protein
MRAENVRAHGLTQSRRAPGSRLPPLLRSATLRRVPDDSFKDFVLDQLTGLPELRAKRMFGGHGLYAGEAFFGILMDGRLYFKTDERTRADYEARGMGPFTYEKARRTISMRYFEVPADVLEDRPELLIWAQRAARAAAAESAARKPAPKPRKRSR